nr:hypothetical protein [uncultured archaeon]
MIYMGFIFYLSSLPNPVEQIVPEKALVYFNFRHFIYHIIEYGILSFLLYRALKTTSKMPQTLAILIAIMYAITDEIHQFYIPGRISSTFDIAIDSFGAIVMQCIINVYEWFKENNKI